MTIELKYNTLNNKKIAYSNETIFEVQIGRYSKGSYKTRYSIKGDLGRAVFYYNGINIGNGYKKRLYCSSMNRPILDRQFS